MLSSNLSSRFDSHKSVQIGVSLDRSWTFQLPHSILNSSASLPLGPPSIAQIYPRIVEFRRYQNLHASSSPTSSESRIHGRIFLNPRTRMTPYQAVNFSSSQTTSIRWQQNHTPSKISPQILLVRVISKLQVCTFFRRVFAPL